MDLERAAGVAVELRGHPDLEVQLAALNVLERAPYDQQLGLKLMEMLKAHNQEVRLRVLKMLVKQRERWAFNIIMQRLVAGASNMEPREAEALGEAMAIIWDRRALHHFHEWIKPKKILSRMKGVMPGQAMLYWGAVSGLVHIKGKEPEALIRLVDKSAGEDLHKHCIQSLVRRRRLLQEANRG